MLKNSYVPQMEITVLNAAETVHVTVKYKPQQFQRDVSCTTSR